ncbi:nitroreductase family protein [Sphingobium sp. AN558]|uniref:nitroreductase family protein n=1 Tax=Sphingobium sp. AN558 TaxID=3133442 RepID=UPI0030BB1EFF
MTSQTRAAAHPIDPIFTERWSPRAFDPTAIPKADLDSMLEAARWAPSAFNYQPWRFLYAHRDGADWQRSLDILLPFNREWAQHASLLLFVLSDSLMDQANGAEPKPLGSHSFDAGAAWASLALQATRLGYHCHGMAGIDPDAARVALEVPDRFRIEAAVAIGRRGDPANLSEALQAREQPSDRKPITDFAFEGKFVR